MEIQVPSNCVQVVFDVFQLFEFSEHLDIFHLISDHLVKLIDKLLPQLESELILSEITQSLVQKPYVHISN